MSFFDYRDHVDEEDYAWIAEAGVGAFARLAECQYSYLHVDFKGLASYCYCVNFIIKHLPDYADELVNNEFAAIVLEILRGNNTPFIDNVLKWLTVVNPSNLARFLKVEDILLLEVPDISMHRLLSVAGMLLENSSSMPNNACELGTRLIKSEYAFKYADVPTVRCLKMLFRDVMNKNAIQLLCFCLVEVHKPAAILGLLEIVDKYAHEYYETVFLFLTYPILERYICPDNFGHFNFVIQKHALDLVCKCFDNMYVRQYPHEEEDLRKIRASLKKAIVSYAFAIEDLLNAYRIATNALTEYVEEENVFLLHLIKYATDPYLSNMVKKLFIVYIGNNHFYTNTLKKLTESDIVPRMPHNENDDAYFKLYSVMESSRIYARRKLDIENSEWDIFTALPSGVLTRLMAEVTHKTTHFMEELSKRLCVLLRVIEPRSVISTSRYIEYTKKTIRLAILCDSVNKTYEGSVFHTLHDVAVLFFEDRPLKDSVRLASRFVSLPRGVHARFTCGTRLLRANACLGDFVDTGHTIRFTVSHGSTHNYNFNLQDERVVADVPEVVTCLSGEIIKFVKHVQKTCNIRIPINLSQEMYIRLMHFGESMNRRSVALQFVHKNPGWFDITTRTIAFVMRNFPLPQRYHVFTTKMLHLEEYKPPCEKPYNMDALVFEYPKVAHHLNVLCRNDVPYSYTQFGVDKTPEVLRMIWCCLRDSLLKGDMHALQVKGDADLDIIGIFLARLLISNYKIPKACGRLSALIFRNVRFSNNEPTFAVFRCIACGFNSVFGDINDINASYSLSCGIDSMLELFTDDEIVDMFFS
jgi:hypothetical protein